MSRLNWFFLLIISLISLSFLSCDDDFESFSTSKNDVLSFSTDIISFDTIFSTINTPRLSFMVYNRNKQSLQISSIDLGSAQNSQFKVNVDGMSGIHFENVVIGAGDSLYVFVDAKLDANGTVAPVLNTDYLVFITNTVQQKITLQAYGQDAYIWRGKQIDESMTLPNDKPYIIYDSLCINENATVTMQEGTSLYMHAKANIIVKGSLKVKGSLNRRVVIRGDRLDYLINIPYDRVPGQWGGIYFATGSFDNELDYAYIRNGSYGIQFELSDPDRSKLKIKNTIITNVSGSLITALNCWIEGENCEFSNSKEALMSLAGGKYQFVHCTLANYYPSNKEWGMSSNRTLVLSNAYQDSSGVKPLPLLQADFTNSIFWGNSSQSGVEIAKDTTKFPNTPFNFTFRNCLIPNKGTNDEQLIDCIFNKDPLFLVTGKKENQELVYDFQVDSLSPARNVANLVASEKIPIDLNGASRLGDEGPDLGAYEWKKQP